MPIEEEEFDRINFKLGRMIFDVAPLINAEIPSLDHLKSYIRIICPELRPQLSLAKSFDDVAEIIRDNCSLTNISLLEDIVDKYLVTSATQLIEDFKSSIKEFGDKQVHTCNFKLKHRCLLKCNTIKFIVNWKIDKCKLNHIKRLLQKAF